MEKPEGDKVPDENAEPQQSALSKMTTCQKCSYFFKNITVEPLLICYLIPTALTALAVDNLNLEKACRVNLRYNDTVCDALTSRLIDNYTEQDNEAQRLVAQMSIWRNALRSSLPAVLVLFVGSWSDRRARRKPLLLVPLVGEFLTCAGLLLCTYFYREWPLEVAGAAQGLFPALTGSTMVMIMAIFSYIGDVTTVEERTFRIGVVNMCVFLCVPLGTVLSGVLFKLIGFYGMFSIAAVFYVLGFFYGVVFIKEGKTPVPRPADVSFFADFFDYRHVVETFSVAYKKREGSQRLRVLLLIVLFVVVLGPSFGEATVGYLFMRNRFKWDEVQASYFATYSEFINFLGTLIMVGLFSRVFKMDDAMIGVTSCVSKIIASFVYAFSFTVWMFYLAPLVDILGGATLISIRSIASKIVPTDELGKINSLFGVCEAFAPFVYGPMFSVVYAVTLDVMSGAFFLFASALTIPAILFFLWMYFLHKKENTQKKKSDLKDIKYTAPSKVDELQGNGGEEDDSGHREGTKEASVITATWE